MVVQPALMSIDWEGFKEKTGEFVTWLGHKISIFWNDYALPFLVHLGEFLKTGYGLATLGILLGCIFLYRAINCSDTRMKCITYCVLAILCFVGAGAALTVGHGILLS